MDWSRKVRSQLPHNRFTVTLLKCHRKHPPRRKDDDVEAEGEIICQVTTPFAQLPQYTSKNGQVWKSIDFQVEMKPRGTILEFAAYFDGQRQQALKVTPPFVAAGEGASVLTGA
jgi:hypothetical protein